MDELVALGKLLAHTTPKDECHEGNWCDITKDKAKEVMEMLDTDGSGGVSYAEVLQFIAVDAAFKQCSSEHTGVGYGLSPKELPCAVTSALKFLQLDGGSRASLSIDEAHDIATLKGTDGILSLPQFCKVFSMVILPNSTPLNTKRPFNSGTPHKNNPTSSPSAPAHAPRKKNPNHVTSFECSKDKQKYDAQLAAGALDDEVAHAYSLFKTEDKDGSGCIDANELYYFGQKVATITPKTLCASDPMCGMSTDDAVECVSVVSLPPALPRPPSGACSIWLRLSL